MPSGSPKISQALRSLLLTASTGVTASQAINRLRGFSATGIRTCLRDSFWFQRGPKILGAGRVHEFTWLLTEAGRAGTGPATRRRRNLKGAISGPPVAADGR